jgi:hypothetical protein
MSTQKIHTKAEQVVGPPGRADRHQTVVKIIEVVLEVMPLKVEPDVRPI